MPRSTSVRLTSPEHLVNHLRTIAHNLWWSWNPGAQQLFRRLSPLLWDTLNHNPVALLASVSDEELIARLGDRSLQEDVQAVYSSFEKYMKGSLVKGAPKVDPKKLVAYFCAEFGLHECLPMYSGGLGILAGDHAKSASDLGLPFVGVGLFYRQGYFQQKIDSGGSQQENYPVTDPTLVPVELVKDKAGKPLLCAVEIGNAPVYFQAWLVRVGRSRLFLLDTDVSANEEHLRGLTGLAYGGDVTLRIRQEIILGIGGVRFLREAGIIPAVFHMNEGHAAFLTLELMREEFQKTKNIQKCEERVRKQCVFTTHTPVPAGHDKFPRDLFEFTMHSYAERLKLSVDDLLAYGNLDGDRNMFTMTILALKLARSANGVSRKHGEVSREMWKELYNVEDTKKVPIGYITNGIHVPTWAAQTTQAFWRRNGGEEWTSKLLDAAFWKKLVGPGGVSDAELWSLRAHLRRQLIDFIRHRAKTQQSIVGGFGEDNIPRLLSPDALTIGYARRFAQYKRAPMIFRDSSRLEKLLNNPSRPVQLIFAGKAHPKDEGGKTFIHEIIEYTRHPHFFGKVVFIENYDMNVARHLISGCDIWLNTPRKPLEACGTSGEKTAINGGLHFSIRDGWWDEAYDGKNGWAIDDAEDAKSPEEQDEHDAESLYQTLEGEIVPLFFKRDKEGVPQGWLARIRQAIRTIVPVYNTDRMVADYIEKYYFPE